MAYGGASRLFGQQCAVLGSPSLTEGPYFVDEMLNRSDIRIEPSDGSIKEGALLQLTFHVTQVDGDTCKALEGAQVDVWHCDASGLYSDESINNTAGQKFLRGYQVTDKLGPIYQQVMTRRGANIMVEVGATLATATSVDVTNDVLAALNAALPSIATTAPAQQAPQGR